MANTTKHETAHPYENNPFFIGLSGLKLFFANAQSTAIYAVVLVAVSFVLGMVANVFDFVRSIQTSGMSPSQMEERDRMDLQAFQNTFQDPGQVAIIAIIVASIVFVIIVVSLLLYGVLEYAGARIALGEKVGLKKAFGEVAKDLAAYLWMYIIVAVKVFLWSLLLIVPGIIMAVRYKLAGTVFFAEGKRGNAAVKRSLELTKGAWLTTFAGLSLWNIITFNQITSLLAPGSNAILYRQLRDVTDAGKPKPPAHWLSWLAFFLPITLFLLWLVFSVLIILLLVITMSPSS